MFPLTPQERNAVIFLAVLWLVGMGIGVYVRFDPSFRIDGLCEIEAKIILNTASYEVLVESRVFTPAAARKFLAYRLEHGPVADISELEEIKGMSRRRLERVREFAFVRP